MPKYIAIDPGRSTGIAIFDNGNIHVHTLNIDEVLEFVSDWQLRNGLDVLIVEPFRTAGRLSKYGLETIDLVGQLKGWAYTVLCPIVLQPPQSRRAWQSIARDSEEPKTQHEADALAHLYQYIDRIVTQDARR